MFSYSTAGISLCSNWMRQRKRSRGSMCNGNEARRNKQKWISTPTQPAQQSFYASIQLSEFCVKIRFFSVKLNEKLAVGTKSFRRSFLLIYLIPLFAGNWKDLLLRVSADFIIMGIVTNRVVIQPNCLLSLAKADRCWHRSGHWREIWRNRFTQFV